MKVVINACFGGFSLSARAVQRLCELRGVPCHFFTYRTTGGGLDLRGAARAVPVEEIEARDLTWMAYTTPTAEEASHVNYRRGDRADPHLIQVIEEMGEAANGYCAELAIVEIPDGVEYTIEEYDGREHVAEKHRTWHA